ncbi:MAG TPA: AAA family ATPase [Candidatus Binataceae bacterium]|nr:AAA family ATPase [Candidatus Binataceae bacterium]
MNINVNHNHSVSRAAKTLRDIFDSGRPLSYIRSSEEQRVVNLIREAGTDLFDKGPAPLWTWSLTEGMRREGGKAESTGSTAREALDFIAAHKGPAIFQLKDFHEQLRDSAEVRRRLRDLYQSCLDQRKFVVISSPVKFIPEELDHDMGFFEPGPPDLVELVDFVRAEAKQIPARGMSVDASEETVHQLARALQGLTLDEARHAVRRALAANKHLGIESIPFLLEEKRLLVSRTGVVDFISQGGDISQVGGLENLKAWLLERKRLFEMRDEISADIVPKGLLMMGIPGCGKSLSVKAIANHFGLPLYRIDMIEIFSGRHGQPAATFVQTCKMLEEMAPAVVWFDEIEMGITSADASGEQGRIFAFFLTWMQEKARGLFVAATANRIDLLPAEMIRKGRFDEVFFVDLPLANERVDIFRIHLSQRGVDPSKFNLEELVDFTKDWTGAEIEQCVVSALTKARLKNRDLTREDLVGVAMGIVPLARTMKEQINHIRQWAFDRAMRATLRPVGR